MKKFSLNNYVYIQIPKRGWDHLSKTQTPGYIQNCVKAHKEVIRGEEWYKLQMHEVFYLFPIKGSSCLIETTVMFEDHFLKDAGKL